MVAVDAYGGAESAADAQKSALLSALAQQGSAGQAAYNQQQQAAQAAQQQAASATADRSGTINAPGALTSQLQGESAGAIAPYAADARAGAGAMSGIMGGLSSAYGNYFEQVKAAIPLARQLAEARAAEEERKRQAEQDDRDQARKDREEQHQWALEDRDYDKATRAEKHQWDLEDRAWEREQRDAKLKDPYSDTISASERATLLAAAREAAKLAHPGAIAKPGTNGKDYKFLGHTIAHDPFGGTPATKGRKKVTVTDAIDTLNDKIGKPHGWVQALLGKDSPDFKGAAKGPVKVQTDKIRHTDLYVGEFSHMQQAFEALTTGPNHLSQAAAKARLRAKMVKRPAYAEHPYVFEQALKDL